VDQLPGCLEPPPGRRSRCPRRARADARASRRSGSGSGRSSAHSQPRCSQPPPRESRRDTVGRGVAQVSRAGGVVGERCDIPLANHLRASVRCHRGKTRRPHRATHRRPPCRRGCTTTRTGSATRPLPWPSPTPHRGAMPDVIGRLRIEVADRVVAHRSEVGSPPQTPPGPRSQRRARLPQRLNRMPILPEDAGRKEIAVESGNLVASRFEPQNEHRGDIAAMTGHEYAQESLLQTPGGDCPAAKALLEKQHQPSGATDHGRAPRSTRANARRSGRSPETPRALEPWSLEPSPGSHPRSNP
jgi:hypothetical protein